MMRMDQDGNGRKKKNEHDREIAERKGEWEENGNSAGTTYLFLNNGFCM